MGETLLNFHVSGHPLIRHKITHMLVRDEETNQRIPAISSQQFYRLMKEVGMLLAYEATNLFLPRLQRFRVPTY